jgi:hypothetical protein
MTSSTPVLHFSSTVAASNSILREFPTVTRYNPAYIQPPGQAYCDTSQPYYLTPSYTVIACCLPWGNVGITWAEFGHMLQLHILHPSSSRFLVFAVSHGPQEDCHAVIGDHVETTMPSTISQLLTSTPFFISTTCRSSHCVSSWSYNFLQAAWTSIIQAYHQIPGVVEPTYIHPQDSHCHSLWPMNFFRSPLVYATLCKPFNDLLTARVHTPRTWVPFHPHTVNPHLLTGPHNCHQPRHICSRSQVSRNPQT